MSGVVMSPEFAEQVKRTVRETLRREHSTRVHQAKWQGRRGGGGGATILFEITAADNTCKEYVTTEVVGGPCGQSPAAGDQINVWDEAGCFFDIPNDEFDNLVGVFGFAVQLQLEIAEAAGSCPEKPECRWVVSQLCCPDPL